MKNSILFQFKEMQHPYPDDPSAKMERWGEIILKVVNENNQCIKDLIDLEWDVKVFLNWFVENETELLTEEFPFETPIEFSIGRSLDEYHRSIVEDNSMIDIIYEYRRRHGLTFALPGTDIPEIYIGLVHKNLTVSCHSDNVKFLYDISLDSLFATVHQLNKL